MRTKFVLGMMIATVMSVPAFARPALKAELTRAMEQNKSHYLGAGRTNASGLAANAQSIANAKILNEMNLSSVERASVQSALAVNPQHPASAKLVEARLENLAALAAARKVSDSLIAKEDPAEAASINQAVDTFVRSIANSVYTRAKTSSRLDKQEAQDAALATDKMEAMGETVMKMDRAERDTYTAIEKKRNEILENGRLSGEEALVEAIMNVKGVDKAKAMEMVRKLKDCV